MRAPWGQTQGSHLDLGQIEGTAIFTPAIRSTTARIVTPSSARPIQIGDLAAGSVLADLRDQLEVPLGDLALVVAQAGLLASRIVMVPHFLRVRSRLSGTVWRGCLLLGMILGASAACRGPDPTPNLVLFTVDTLRADYLGAYGSKATRTPRLDRLAAEGTLFENAAAPMPVTRPSHFTMFTSRYPREHGVVDNHLSLPEEEITLAEVLRKAGYRTAAFTGVVILGPRSGGAQGFEVFDAPGPRQRERRATEVVEKAGTWLGALDPGEPFFLWVHVFDPHVPYEPPAIFRPEGKGPNRVGPGVLRRMARAGRGNIGREDFDRTTALYAGEVEAVDAAFGLLERELEEQGLAEETVTLFTADHGECFEKGFFFRHAGCLYEGAIHVPWIVRYPNRVTAAHRVAAPVEHVDLAPTLLAFAGVERPVSFVGRALFAADGTPSELSEDHRALIQHPLPRPDGFRGRRDLWRGIDSVLGEPFQPMIDSTEQVGLRSARWKYLATLERTEELYDLAEDPEEERNVAAARPGVVEELRSTLRRQLHQHPLTRLDPGKLDPELAEQLEALGYL